MEPTLSILAHSLETDKRSVSLCIATVTWCVSTNHNATVRTAMIVCSVYQSFSCVPANLPSFTISNVHPRGPASSAHNQYSSDQTRRRRCRAPWSGYSAPPRFPHRAAAHFAIAGVRPWDCREKVMIFIPFGTEDK